MKFVLFFLCVISFSQAKAQLGNDSKFPSYFGFQVKPLFPAKYIGKSSLNLTNQGYNVTINQKVGYSFGGVVRVALSDIIGIETGINFNQRYYHLEMSVADSNVSTSNDFGFIQYDVPVNALFYVKLTKKWLMNAAIGPSICYKPSSVGVINHPEGKHEFFNIGLVSIHKKVNLDLTGNLGFEFRSKNSGIFYLGGSARIPTAPLFDLVSRYKYETYEVDNYGSISGSFLSIDFKYFIPNTGGNGQNFEHGPIE